MATGARPSVPVVAATKALGEDKDPSAETRVPRPLPAVADEARLVHAALMAARSGQRERALALFDEHAFRYPHGALAEERDAKRALVLADLGRTPDARAAIDHFLRTYPASPLATRLRERLRDLDSL
jgi:TolA-binding protein